MDRELYKKILGVEWSKGNPLQHYILLKIKLFESDGELIHKAGLKQMKKLREWQLHPDAKIRQEVQEMLNEISMACSILEVEAKKKVYDQKLSKQLGIALSTDRPYKTLTIQSKLSTCPNCKAQVSRLAILCIECGYNFQTKQRLQTTLEVQPPDHFHDAVSSISHRLKSGWSNFWHFCLRMLVWSYKLVVILLIIGAVLGGAYFVTKFMGKAGLQQNYTFYGEFDHSSKVKQMINKSKLWKRVFNKYSRQGEPGVHFAMEWGRDCHRRINYIDMTVYLTKRKRVIYRVKIAYANYPSMMKQMKKHLKNAAKAALQN